MPISCAPAARRGDFPALQVSSRSSWSGQLILGATTVTVKAYPVLVTTSSGPLHQVHAECGNRIEYRKTCPQHGEVAPADIMKAYSVAPDDNVVLTAGDLAGIQPPDDKTIRVKHLVSPEKIDLALLSGRSLYLVPANALAEDHYALIAVALGRSDAWAVATVILSENRQLVVIRLLNGLLVMHVLHWPALRRACPAFSLRTNEITTDRVKGLEKSFTPLRRAFSWNEYVDSFDHDLTQLVRRKIAARARAAVTTAEGKPRRGDRSRRAIAETARARAA